jgi:uncharacterized membrane protein
MELETVYGYRDQAMRYGLATVMALAGLSKFLLPELWVGYEPRLIVNLLPLTAEQLMYAGGFVEAAMGASLFLEYRVRATASLVCLWLLAITASVASMQLWTIALRDLGLLVLAYAVAAND